MTNNAQTKVVLISTTCTFIFNGNCLYTDFVFINVSLIYYNTFRRLMEDKLMEAIELCIDIAACTGTIFTVMNYVSRS